MLLVGGKGNDWMSAFVSGGGGRRDATAAANQTDKGQDDQQLALIWLREKGFQSCAIGCCEPEGAGSYFLNLKVNGGKWENK